MDKNDFTRIYIYIGYWVSAGGVLVSCSDFQTDIGSKNQYPDGILYYKNRQGKTMSMFIYFYNFVVYFLVYFLIIIVVLLLFV